MTITYQIPAKPTLYKGQTFRSRLEAKWAAFFDILEWEWEFEPFHFGGWIPDFAIRAPGADSVRKIVLVEVKPIMEFDTDVAQKMAHNCPMSKPSQPREYELLLLGIAPTEEMLGWLCDGSRIWAEAVFGRWGGQRRIGFCHMSQSWRDRISGQYDGGKPDGASIQRLWYEADCYVDPDVEAELGDIVDLDEMVDRNARPYLLDYLAANMPKWETATVSAAVQWQPTRRRA